MNRLFKQFKSLAATITYKLQNFQGQCERHYADRLQRKAYELLDIAHMEGMPVKLHDEIEVKAYLILDRARHIRLNSYRF